MPRSMLALVILFAASPAAVHAQFATVGVGALFSRRDPEPVFEFHAETPPVLSSRAYFTLSWSDESAAPTIITAAERSIVRSKPAVIGLGAGLLWLEGNDYRPYPIVVSSMVVPLPVPRTAVVAIASTQPFQEFEWSLVLNVSVTLWFRR